MYVLHILEVFGQEYQSISTLPKLVQAWDKSADSKWMILPLAPKSLSKGKLLAGMDRY